MTAEKAMKRTHRTANTSKEVGPALAMNILALATELASSEG
jgi:hypothetical protein